jgi:glycosyltransferase involved in cell wall biosynthesis
MDTTKIIDVIIPAYKAEQSIRRTMASIAMQTAAESIRVTIVSDGDGVDYLGVCSDFSRILEIRQVSMDLNSGPGAARQMGIDSTELEFITFIDADDTFASSFSLETMLLTITSDERCEAISGIFMEELGPSAPSRFRAHTDDLIWVFGKMYRRSFLERKGIKFTSTRANEDTGFNAKVNLCRLSNEKIGFLQEVVYYWHFRSDSITKKNNYEYELNQNVPGYLFNMSDAISLAKKTTPTNPEITKMIVEVMYISYIFIQKTKLRAPKFYDRNLLWAARFYNDHFRELESSVNKEQMTYMLSDCATRRSAEFSGILPEKTVSQFISEISLIEPSRYKRLKRP